MGMNCYLKIEAKPEELLALSAIAESVELPEEVKNAFDALVKRAEYAVDYSDKLRQEEAAYAAWEAEVVETEEKRGKAWDALVVASNTAEEARIVYVHNGGVVSTPPKGTAD